MAKGPPYAILPRLPDQDGIEGIPGVYGNWPSVKRLIGIYTKEYGKAPLFKGAFESEDAAWDWIEEKASSSSGQRQQPRGKQKEKIQPQTKSKRSVRFEKRPPNTTIELPMTAASDETIAQLHSDPENLIIYVDASTEKKRSRNKHMKYAVFSQWYENYILLSEHITQEMLEFLGIDEDRSVIGNNAAEMIAILQALVHLDDILGALTDIAPAVIWIITDSEFSIKIISGEFKPKLNYIARLHEIITQVLDETPHCINFAHVPGHSGFYGNEVADETAGSVEEHHLAD